MCESRDIELNNIVVVFHLTEYDTITGLHFFEPATATIRKGVKGQN
jgi:hypothetical protein